MGGCTSDPHCRGESEALRLRRSLADDLKTIALQQRAADQAVQNSTLLLLKIHCPELVQTVHERFEVDARQLALVESLLRTIVSRIGLDQRCCRPVNIWSKGMRLAPDDTMHALCWGDELTIWGLKIIQESLEADIHLAAKADDLAELQSICANTPHRVDERQAGGGTALHGAASYGQAAAVNVLLGARADLEAKDSSRGSMHWTAMHHAAMNGHATVVELLLNSKADANSKCQDGTTPLYWATTRRHDDCAAIIHRAGGYSESDGQYFNYG